MCSIRRHYSSLSTDPLFVFSHCRDRQFSKIKWNVEYVRTARGGAGERQTRVCLRAGKSLHSKKLTAFTNSIEQKH